MIATVMGKGSWLLPLALFPAHFILNTAASVILSKWKSGCVTPQIRNFQWLPMSLRVKAEVLTKANQVLNALTFLLFLLHLLTTILPGPPIRKRLSSISPCWNGSNERTEIFVMFTAISQIHRRALST